VRLGFAAAKKEHRVKKRVRSIGGGDGGDRGRFRRAAVRVGLPAAAQIDAFDAALLSVISRQGGRGHGRARLGARGGAGVRHPDHDPVAVGPPVRPSRRRSSRA